ncbi:VWA domain-containing protein [Arthrobacter sp. UYP6]|uniref:vWA domain-containing protein n=1 Tax=Arthrobacter sp. UYP6 TaxID=1756378 RepID=UPI003395BAB3
MTLTADGSLQPRFETAAFAAGLGTALRRAGIGVSPDRSARLAQALALVPPAVRSDLYWTARVVMLRDAAQIPVFDAVFAALFDGLLDPSDSRGDPNAPPAAGSEPRPKPAAEQARRLQQPACTEPDPADKPVPSAPGGSDASEPPARDAVLMYSSDREHLHTKNFADLSEAELAQVRLLVRQIHLSTPLRRTRRTRPAGHRGRLDPRRSARAARRTGGLPVTLVRAERMTAQRRLVLLCDVSGSMTAFTRVYLTLLQGAVTGSRAEAFVFSTGLTRLTRQLSVQHPDTALGQAGAGTDGWDSGTRLAAGLRVFLDRYGRRGLARGAVVVIFSDGWTQDDPAQVDREMARLQRLAHRVIWVNPRKAAPGFAPLAGGMAAALPYCSAFVSGHSYTALTELAGALARSETSTHPFERTGSAHGH